MEETPLKKSKWPLLRNVIRAVTLFKTHDASEAEDLNKLITEIKAIPTDQVYRLNRSRTNDNSAYSVAIKDLRRQQSIFRCAERGSAEDLRTIQLEFEQDPYRILRDNKHPHALINKKNNEGQSPLYMACKHGNLEVVQFLLAQGADHLITSTIDGEEETCLEVAVRWAHSKIVEELLKKEWSNKSIGKAKKLCRTQEMVQMLSVSKKKTKKKTWRFCCFKKEC